VINRIKINIIKPQIFLFWSWLCAIWTRWTIKILMHESFSRAKLYFQALMTRKLCRAISSKVLRSWKTINIGVESVKATARIEPNGYKKKLLASQTHLDLQTVPAHSRSLFLSSLFILNFHLGFCLARYSLAISLNPFSFLFRRFISYHSLLFPRLPELFPDSAAPHS